MALKLDLHLHTHYSPDSWLSLKSLVRSVVRKKIDGVAVTDHDTLRGALKLREMAPPFKVIIGEEVSSSDGDIIGLFLNKTIPAGLSAEATIEKIKAQGGLVAIPHPFDRVRSCRLKLKKLQALADQIDMIEVFNGRTLWPQAAQKAQRFAKQRQLPQVAGSDAHSQFELAKAYTIIEDFQGPLDFLENAKKPKWLMDTILFGIIP